MAARGGSSKKVKVLLACSGLGHVRRGYEAATTEMAAALSDRIDLTLARGGGAWFFGDGLRLPCLQRRGKIASLLGLNEPEGYLWEQRSFSLWLYALARLGNFDLVQLRIPHERSLARTPTPGRALRDSLHQQRADRPGAPPPT